MESDRQRDRRRETETETERERNTENLSMKGNDEHKYSCIKLKV